MSGRGAGGRKSVEEKVEKRWRRCVWVLAHVCVFWVGGVGV